MGEKFHSILIGRNEDSFDDKIKDGIWLEELQKRDSLFYSFIDQWIIHALHVTKSPPSDIDWFFFYLFI